MTQLTAQEKGQLDCQLKHRARKTTLTAVCNTVKNDWCTIKMDLLGRM